MRDKIFLAMTSHLSTGKLNAMEHLTNTAPEPNAHFLLEGKQVLISGSRPMMIALISFYLEREGNAKTVLCDGLDDAEAIIDKSGTPIDVVLWDVHGLENNFIMDILQKIQLHKKTKLALLDVNRSSLIEKQALVIGIRGFFYFGDPLPLLLKGVHFISDGSIWAPRKVLESFFVNGSTPSVEVKDEPSGLTSREIDVLMMVSEGSGNADIADKLHISQHTVKAHLHNAFKKIGVSNRIQAARWAIDNLPQI